MKKQPEFTAKGKAYLKKAAKGNGLFVVVADENDIFLLTACISVKCPRPLYRSIFQPIVLQEAPASGAGFSVTDRAFESGQHYLNLWDRCVKDATNSALITPYRKDTKLGMVSILSIGEQPAYIDDKFMDCFNFKSMEVYGSGALNAFYFRGTFLEALIFPLCPTSIKTEPDSAISKYPNTVEN